MSDNEVNDILRRLGLNDIEDLEVEITQRFYDEVAECLSDWKCLARQKGINTDDIEADHSKRKDQKIQFLMSWKSMESFNATFKDLVKTLFGAKLVNDARRVVELFLSELNHFMYIANYLVLATLLNTFSLKPALVFPTEG